MPTTVVCNKQITFLLGRVFAIYRSYQIVATLSSDRCLVNHASSDSHFLTVMSLASSTLGDRTCHRTVKCPVHCFAQLPHHQLSNKQQLFLSVAQQAQRSLHAPYKQAKCAGCTCAAEAPGRTPVKLANHSAQHYAQKTLASRAKSLAAKGTLCHRTAQASLQ